jgi:hypothetical protein
MPTTTYTQAGLGEGLNYITWDSFTGLWATTNRILWADFVVNYTTIKEASATTYTDVG